MVTHIALFKAEVNRALCAAADLVNTAGGPRTGNQAPDTLVTLQDLSEFLQRQEPQLQWPRSAATDSQLKKVRELRERLSRVWGLDPVVGSDDLELVNQLLDGVGITLVRSEVDGESVICEVPVPVSSDLHDLMCAAIAVALSRLVLTGEEGRLLICRGDECEAAIVDLTRSRSKRFCGFGNCANRAHVRAYRARKAAKNDRSEMRPRPGGSTVS